MKRLLIFLTLGLVAGITASLLVERYLVYDSVFFRRCAEVSDAWAAKVREQGKPCVVLAGGSETRMGVDPALMLDRFGVPVINAAGNAGFGVQCNIVSALPYLRTGDTLVLSVLSAHSMNNEPTSAGLKFCLFRQGLAFFSSGIVPLTPKNISSILLGNVGPLVVALTRQTQPYEQRYRYHHETVVHPSGWVEVQQRRVGQLRFLPTNVSKLSPPAPLDVQNYLMVQSYCRKRVVEFAVHFPVQYWSPHMRFYRAYWALALTRAGVPVVKDYRHGVLSEYFYFADTREHLSDVGARENSLILARAFKERAYWTESELISELRKLGWRGDLSPEVTNPAR